MNTLNIHLNKKVQALSAEHPYEDAVFRALCLLAAMLMLSYLYLVSASVLNVIAQKEADTASADLQSHLGELEAKYFSLSEDITIEHAQKLGLRPIADSSYVYRLDTVGVAPSTHNAI